MDAEELSDYMQPFLEGANVGIQAFCTSKPLGFAIPIPEEATDEAKQSFDQMLTRKMWSFERCLIGKREYYTLFPFGK